MSKVRFISDLHLGHNKIVEFSSSFRGNVTTVDEHDQWIVEQWNKVVRKQDLVYVLGDVCFDKNKLPLLDKMWGTKHLIFGNHDKFSLDTYLRHFNKVHGFMKYKGQAWLSHSPVHDGSLRKLFNIHGHVHQRSVDDIRYFNVSVEALDGKPITWEEIKEEMAARVKVGEQE